jgi:alkanesulfonate monooxygenase SsuD/methylene tetrahydromethanopterin reductase-like flavin-dependent oxidoreductase (luciferase family)
MPTLDRRPEDWREAVRRLEGAGYATVAVSDHVTRGWAMDPLVALMAAADATERLRVLSLVLSNDYRHPALVHKAIATIDVLSGGRVELGLGAGWLADDYDALGLPIESVQVRVDRLAESVRLLKQLFATNAPFDFERGIGAVASKVAQERRNGLVRRSSSVAAGRASSRWPRARRTSSASTHRWRGRPAERRGLPGSRRRPRMRRSAGLPKGQPQRAGVRTTSSYR